MLPLELFLAFNFAFVALCPSGIDSLLATEDVSLKFGDPLILAMLVVLAIAIVMWLPHRQEYRADASGTSRVWRHKLIAGLRRLWQAQNAPSLPEGMRAFTIGADRVEVTFDNHPQLDKRIAALRTTA